MEAFTMTVRASAADAHYAGGLCAGALVMEWFGDAATGLLLALDGTEGLLAAYEDVQFKHPLFAGDFCRVTASLSGSGRRSRRLEFTCERIIRVVDGHSKPHEAEVIVTARAVAVV